MKQVVTINARCRACALVVVSVKKTLRDYDDDVEFSPILLRVDHVYINKKILILYLTGIGSIL